MAFRAVPGLSAQLEDLPVVQGHAPWPGHEYARGWGVFALPFDSGHVLALRVFPQNDFGPYRAVWHRDPDGRWSIYVDGARLDTACPRYYGPACDVTGYARIGLTWTGPATLRVTMDSPALEWTLTATSTRILALLNTMSAALPLATWRRRSLVRARATLDGADLGRPARLPKTQRSAGSPCPHAVSSRSARRSLRSSIRPNTSAPGPRQPPV
jgi:hypothetical protein